MSLIRRLLVFLAGLAILVLLTILALAPEQVGTVNIYIRGALVVLVDAALVVLLFRQLRRSGAKPTSSGLMVRAGGAITDVSVDSARERILKAVREVPDVTSASAHVEAIHGRADVDLDVVVSGSTIKIPAKQKELDRALRQVIGKELGLQMAGHPRVHIQFQQPGSVPPVPPATVPAATPAPPPPAAPVEPVKTAPATPAPVVPSGLFGKTLPREEPEYGEEADEDYIDTVKMEKIPKPSESPAGNDEPEKKD